MWWWEYNELCLKSSVKHNFKEILDFYTKSSILAGEGSAYIDESYIE